MRKTKADRKIFTSYKKSLSLNPFPVTNNVTGSSCACADKFETHAALDRLPS